MALQHGKGISAPTGGSEKSAGTIARSKPVQGGGSDVDPRGTTASGGSHHTRPAIVNSNIGKEKSDSVTYIKDKVLASVVIGSEAIGGREIYNNVDVLECDNEDTNSSSSNPAVGISITPENKGLDNTLQEEGKNFDVFSEISALRTIINIMRGDMAELWSKSKGYKRAFMVLFEHLTDKQLDDIKHKYDDLNDEGNEIIRKGITYASDAREVIRN